MTDETDRERRRLSNDRRRARWWRRLRNPKTINGLVQLGIGLTRVVWLILELLKHGGG